MFYLQLPITSLYHKEPPKILIKSPRHLKEFKNNNYNLLYEHDWMRTVVLQVTAILNIHIDI